MKRNDKKFIKKYSNFHQRKMDGKIFTLVSGILDDENYLLMSRHDF
jgi:hypothetical protein